MKHVALLAIAVIVIACRDAQPLEPRSPVSSPGASLNLSGPATANATVTWLGELEDAPGGVALGINATGAIVGGRCCHPWRGIIFAPGPVRAIQLSPAQDPPQYVGDGVAINEAGQIAGDGGGFGYVADLGGTATSLPVIPGGWGIHWANDINNAGDLVGLSRMATNFNEWHATLWRRTPSGYEAHDLGLFDGANTDASAIAPGLSGGDVLIVGTATDIFSTGIFGFVWRNGVMTRLPPLTPFRFHVAPHDVADNGMVVGESDDHAVLWHDGQVIDLHPPCAGLFTDRSGPSRARAIAFTSSVPSRVLIVGVCAALPTVWYDDGQGGYIAELLPLLEGDAHGEAYDVNASGQIVGHTGTNPVRWTFNVPGTGQPPTPPTITAPPNLAVNTDPGVCVASVNPGTATATGASSVVGSRSDGLGIGDPYPNGMTTITWTATGPTGLTASATQTVAVSDNEPPSVTSSPDVTVNNDPGLGSAVVDPGVATAGDNCPGAVVGGARSDGETLGAPYPVGTTVITWTATDGSGNSARAAQRITVIDVDPPLLSLPADFSRDAETADGAVVTYVATASDNVGVGVPVCSPASGSTFAIGVTTVTCSATDAAGLSATGTFAVTVRGASEQIEDLIELTRDTDLPPALEAQLIVRLESALADPDAREVACRALSVFIAVVRAQSTGTNPTISPATATELIARATRIRNVLACT